VVCIASGSVLPNTVGLGVDGGAMRNPHVCHDGDARGCRSLFCGVVRALIIISPSETQVLPWQSWGGGATLLFSCEVPETTDGGGVGCC
jgi:hypothetical protein